MPLKTTLRREKSTRKRGFIILFVLMAFLVVALLVGLKYYQTIFGSNVHVKPDTTGELFIPSNPTYEEVVALIEHSGLVKDVKAFDRVARLKRYTQNPRGGRYVVKDGMSNNELVNLLRSGRQTALNVTFTNVRWHEELAGQMAARLEPDSVQFLEAFKDEAFLSTLGVEPHTLLGMILPNTYQMYWTTTPEEFVVRMHREFERFWNEERMQKAYELRLSPIQIATLASIVDEETIRGDEKARVAGLYINRLNIGMRLQADPTIKFTIGDFTVSRILNRDLEVDSPYNTYKYAGLPPGPIRMPSISGIEAVLNYEEHDYLYMCARDDFSGYHAFAKTLRQHNVNAAKYRQALSRRRIYR
jgi:UPF0755 protein